MSMNRPVMPFAENRGMAPRTVVPKKRVTVRADSVQRVGNTVYMRNPTKVDVTRIVPKERVTVSRAVTPSSVRVESITRHRVPVAVIQKQEGKPVVANSDHFPMHPSEIGVEGGEPLLYLGSSNNWSRVRKHTGEEGYIPHSRISQ